MKNQRIESKDKQLAAQAEQLTQLTAALEHTTTSLQAFRTLHAGTMQQLSAADGGGHGRDDLKDLHENKVGKHKWCFPTLATGLFCSFRFSTQAE